MEADILFGRPGHSRGPDKKIAADSPTAALKLPARTAQIAAGTPKST